jgi:mannose-6-phosphate isomerase-like protein (cupin superfamily)
MTCCAGEVLPMSDAVARWGQDGYVFTEAARGGPLAWRTGRDKLDGDALGPVRHAHDGAGEYYYMFSGSAHVETGGHEFVLEEGEFGYIPPDVPHNFLGPSSDRDACLFCVVSPNHVGNKWRLRDFDPAAVAGEMVVTRPFAGDQLPSDANLAAHGLTLAKDDSACTLRPDGFEVVYLVVDGTATLVSNGLRATMDAGTFVLLRDGQAHSLGTDSKSRVLRIDSRFQAWQGVPLRPDAG